MLPRNEDSENLQEEQIVPEFNICKNILEIMLTYMTRKSKRRKNSGNLAHNMG